MKSLEIVVKDIAKAKEVAKAYGVEIISHKEISVKHYITLAASSDSLVDFVDEFFLNSAVRPYYIDEILSK